MELVFKTWCGLGVNRNPQSGRQTCLYPRGKRALAVVLSCSLGSPYRMTYRVVVFIEALNPWTEPAWWRFKNCLVLLRVRFPRNAAKQEGLLSWQCPSCLFIFLRFILCLFICICLHVTSAQVSLETRRHCVLWDIELLDIGTGNWQAVRACHHWAISP